MSDLLIKNKDMPKSCGECPLVLEYFSKFEKKNVIHCQARLEGESRFVDGFDFSTRSEHCPLVELPKNHGRIADLDKVLDWLVNEKRVFSMAMSAKIVKALSDAPVILEASEYECPHYQGVCGLNESIICYAKSNENCPVKTSGKASFNCSAPNCLDCERNDDCNSIGM